jgi:endonuclease III
MATTINKHKVIDKLFSSLGKQARGGDTTSLPVLEQFIYALCREGTTRDNADVMFRALQERFYDWNELRVSSAHEVAEAMDHIVPDAEARGQRVIDFLQEVFDTTFAFDLERLQKEGLKQAAKKLSRYQAANDYAVSWVVQHSMGGHSIPLDEPSMRVLRRLGVLEEEGDLEALRASLEHQVPKAKGSQFVDLVSVLADGFCASADPDCPSCPMCSSCPTGATNKAAMATTAKKPR